MTPKYPQKLDAFKPMLEAWRDLVAEEATITARAMLELFAEQLKAPTDQAGFEADLTAASTAAGNLIAKKAVESLIATALPSVFAGLSLSYKTGKASNSREEKKGAERAPWKSKALALLKDQRTKLLDKTPLEIILGLIDRNIIAQSGEVAYCDVATGKQCARRPRHPPSRQRRLLRANIWREDVGA